jgi:hypothetical protein
MKNSKADIETELIRSEAKRLFRETEAICTLVKSITADTRPHFAKIKKGLDTWDKARLQKFLLKAQQEIGNLRKNYGVKVPNSELVEILDWAESKSGNLLPLLPKYTLREIFDCYERVMPDFADLPEHTDIAVDSSDQAGLGKTALFLLEAMLYEDMASIFNLMKEHQLRLNHEKDPLKVHKTLGSLCRGTLAAAFYFVESYLNGIAFDHYVLHEGALGPKEKEALLEWDFAKNRAKHLSLREKALQYPRIILGTAHPPLQESNCPELAFIVEKSKTLRDAIVHAAPRLRSDPSGSDKRQTVYLIGPIDVETAVDNVVRLVRRIETTVRGNKRRISWLYDRASDGFFPDAAFE